MLLDSVADNRDLSHKFVFRCRMAKPSLGDLNVGVYVRLLAFNECISCYDPGAWD